jgi:hypothetical protein
MKIVCAGLVLWGALGIAAGSDTEDLEAKAAKIRPTAEETRFQRDIPWYLDPAEALEAAKKEKRPVFCWTVDGDPWDRL